MKRTEIIFGILRIPVDFLATVLAFFTAYELRTFESLYFLFGAPTGPVDPLDVYFRFSLAAGLLLIMIFALDGMYTLKSTMSRRREMKEIIFLTAAWFMIIIAYFFVMRIQFFSRLILGYAFILTFLFIIVGRLMIRLVQKYFLARGFGTRRVLILGTSHIALEIKALLERHPAYEVVGIVENTDLKTIESLITHNRVDELLQTQSLREEDRAEDILELCRTLHVSYRFVPNLLEVQRTNIDLAFMKGIPVITLKETSLDAWGRVVKRLFDAIVSLMLLILLSPLLLLIALLIKIDSRGPVLYRSRRVTQRAGTFYMYKFRSMVPDADVLKADLQNLNHREGPLFKVKNDPRITRLGKFLRRYSLDELPQLMNVLRGEMSLVGPRPHLPEEVAKYERHHKRVLSIKPGITGLSQISGRSDLSFEEEVTLDLYYIENWSIWKDIIILLKTAPVVLLGKAAD